MDPHFREYMAAVAGMQEVYGIGDDHAGVAEGDLRIGLSPDGRPAIVEAVSAGVGGC